MASYQKKSQKVLQSFEKRASSRKPIEQEYRMSAQKRSALIRHASTRPAALSRHEAIPNLELPKRTAYLLSITSVLALALFVSPLVLAVIGLLSGMV